MLDMKEEMQYRKITNTKTAQNPKWKPQPKDWWTVWSKLIAEYQNKKTE
jgi:hypothetical protein